MPDSKLFQKQEPEYGLSRLLQETFNLREDNLGAILQELLSAARMYLGMEVGFISQFEGDQRTFKYLDLAEGVKMVKVGHADPLDESYCKHVVEGKLPGLIHNAQDLPAAEELPATQELGVGAHMSVPIRMSDGSVYGTFCTFSFWSDQSLNERDMALMRVFSKIAAQLIEQDIQENQSARQRRNRVEALLKDDAYRAVWQPIVDIASGSIVGLESLTRFPPGSELGVSEWFNEAREVGLAGMLEARALKRGLAILPHLPGNLCVACNISAEGLLSGSIDAALERLPLDRIVLEITEHDIIEDYAKLSEKLEPLRQKGLRLAVDDAGAGYASFRHIIRLLPDVIKLDMSLTRHLDSDITRRSLASSLVRFAHETGARLVAEGVETQAEYDTIKQLGFQLAQGFYLYKPQPQDEVLALFRGRE